MPAGEQYEPARGVALALDPRPRQRDDMEIIALRGALGYHDHHDNPSIWSRFAPGPFFVVCCYCGSRVGRSQCPFALLEGLREPKCDLAAQRPEGQPGRISKLAVQDGLKPDGGRDHLGGVGAHDEDIL